MTSGADGTGTAGRPEGVDLHPWDVYIVGTCAVVAVLVARDAAPTAGARTLGLLAVVALAVEHVALGRRLQRAEVQDTPAAAGHLFLTWVLLGVAVTCSAPAGWLLVALCPALFLLLSWRWGVPAVALLALTQPAIDFLGPRQDPAAALDGVWRALAVVALSAVLSLWFDDLERRSGERAALVAELRSSRAQVAELSRRAGQDAERARLAADIHDTLAQGFLSILTLVRASRGTLDRPAGADLDAVRSLLDLAGSTAEDNLAEARSMVAALSPPALAESGLVGALQRRATQLQAGTGIRTSVLVEAADAGPALPREVEVVLLRAAQELMTNAGKHSAADAVVVTLAVQAGQVVLRVADDGRGLDGATPAAGPGSTGQDARGFGLDGLQRRIADLGGTLVLTGRTPAEREGPGGGGRGTLATVVLPTPQDDP